MGLLIKYYNQGMVIGTISIINKKIEMKIWQTIQDLTKKNTKKQKSKK